MNDYLFIIPIAIAAIIGVMSPGPSFIFVAQTTLSKSRNHGIATSLGMGTGAMIFTLLACFGLYVVLEKAPFLYGSLKFIGGLYLLYLAYKIWLSTKTDTTQSDAEIDSSLAVSEAEKTNANDFKFYIKSYIKSYILGLLTQLSNPKTAIVIGSFIMALLPSEVPPYSFLIIAVLTLIIDAGWYCIVSVALSTPKAQRFYNRFKKHINLLASGLMAVLGLKLALSL